MGDKDLWDFVIVPNYFEEESNKPGCYGKRKRQETKEVDKRKVGRKTKTGKLVAQK